MSYDEHTSSSFTYISQMGVWWIVLVVAVLTHTASAAVREYHWEVEYKYWSPDCKEGAVMTVNGEFPGPTIKAFAGDTIVVNLTNKLTTEGLVIHWHGIRQVLSLFFHYNQIMDLESAEYFVNTTEVIIKMDMNFFRSSIFFCLICFLFSLYINSMIVSIV